MWIVCRDKLRLIPLSTNLIRLGEKFMFETCSSNCAYPGWAMITMLDPSEEAIQAMVAAQVVIDMRDATASRDLTRRTERYIAQLRGNYDRPKPE